MINKLTVLQSARFKGRVEHVGGDDLRIALVADLVAEELLRHSPRGITITAAGRAHADKLLDAERALLDRDAVSSIYLRFVEFDAECKDAVTRWQMVDLENGVLNDHTDATYDQCVIDRLVDLHARIQPLLADIAAAIPRLATAKARFAAAVAHLERGDGRYVAAPILDSFHTIWFELHEELISADGRTRAEEAVHGRG